MWWNRSFQTKFKMFCYVWFSVDFVALYQFCKPKPTSTHPGLLYCEEYSRTLSAHSTTSGKTNKMKSFKYIWLWPCVQKTGNSLPDMYVLSVICFFIKQQRYLYKNKIFSFQTSFQYMIYTKAFIDFVYTSMYLIYHQSVHMEVTRQRTVAQKMNN